MSPLPTGSVNTATDQTDLEMTLTKQRILSQLKFGSELPDLVKVTSAGHDRSFLDTVATAEVVINKDAAAVVYVSGVLVHGPAYSHYFWPGNFELHMPDGTVDLLPDLLALERKDYEVDYRSFMLSRAASICHKVPPPLANDTDIRAPVIQQHLPVESNDLVRLGFETNTPRKPTRV